MKQVYLDNAATTPMSPTVIDVITDEMANDFGNASSTHTLGRKARNSVETARHTIAQAINAKDQEIIFTSGGSESNNTVIFGVAEMQKAVGRHLITTKIEHESVLKSMQRLEELGYEVTYLDVDRDGHISLDQLREAIRPDTILVSVMAVNNEVGSINPLKDIGQIVKDSQAWATLTWTWKKWESTLCRLQPTRSTGRNSWASCMKETGSVCQTGFTAATRN